MAKKSDKKRKPSTRQNKNSLHANDSKRTREGDRIWRAVGVALLTMLSALSVALFTSIAFPNLGDLVIPVQGKQILISGPIAVFIVVGIMVRSVLKIVLRYGQAKPSKTD